MIASSLPIPAGARILSIISLNPPVPACIIGADGSMLVLPDLRAGPTIDHFLVREGAPQIGLVARVGSQVFEGFARLCSGDKELLELRICKRVHEGLAHKGLEVVHAVEVGHLILHIGEVGAKPIVVLVVRCFEYGWRRDRVQRLGMGQEQVEEADPVVVLVLE